MNQDPTKNPSLRAYLRPLWRRKWLIAALVVVVTGVTYAYYHAQPKQYSANTTLYLEPTGANALLGSASGNAQYTQRTVDDQASLIQSPAVAVIAARLLGGHRDPQKLLSAINVSPDSTDDFVTVSTQSRSPRFAARLVNAFAQAYLALQRQTSLKNAQTALATTERELRGLGPGAATAGARATLQATAAQLQAEVALPSADAEQVDVATPPTAAVSPKPTRDALYALVLSLLLGVVAAYLLERFDQRLGEADDLTPLYGNHVLASIPLARSGPDAAQFQEAFRTLRTALVYARNGAQPPASILVTSASPDDGKTTVVRNLAAAYAETGARVVAVDCDLRQAKLAEAFGVAAGPGLSDVLVGAATVRSALQNAALDDWPPGGAESTSSKLPPGQPVAVLTAGTQHANVAALLASPALPRTLAALKRSHDVVILDTPPVLAVSDALALVALVDGVLVVSRVGATTAEQAEQALRLLERTHGVQLLGVVANGARQVRSYAGYGYSGHGAARART